MWSLDRRAVSDVIAAGKLDVSPAGAGPSVERLRVLLRLPQEDTAPQETRLES